MKPGKNIDDVLKRDFDIASDQDADQAGARVWHRLQAGGASGSEARINKAQPPAMHRWRGLPLAAAAVIVMTAALGTALVWRPADAALYHVVDGAVRQGETVHSNGGGGAVLALSDGSRVEMRSNSELAVERASDGIRIRLDRGGIIVNAAKQRTGHLYVQTKDMTVSVVGTVFVVNADNDGSRVAVIEGEVRVQRGATETKLRPGERVASSPTTDGFSVASELAWSRRAGTLVALMHKSTVEQQPPAGMSVQSAPEFEVASIRPATPGVPASQKVGPARLDVVNTSLLSLLMAAFRVETYELSAPSWLREVRFDIQATFPADARAHVHLMLQRLLVKRFGLVTHREPRQVPAYELSIDSGGLRIPEAEPANDLEKDFSKEPAASSGGGFFETIDGPARAMAVPSLFGSRIVTTRSLYMTWTTSRQTMEIDATRITMPEFAGILRLNLDRPVIDKTGLTGVYRFKVELDRLATAARMLDSLPPDRQAAFREPTGVSTFKAVEGLGLKIEERRSPIDVLVVDKIERSPTEN